MNTKTRHLQPAGGQAFVDKLAVLRALSRPESSHRRDQKAGLAPPWISIGSRRAGLLEGELAALMAARAAGLSLEQQRRVVDDLLAHRKALAAALQEGRQCA